MASTTPHLTNCEGGNVDWDDLELWGSIASQVPTDGASVRAVRRWRCTRMTESSWSASRIRRDAAGPAAAAGRARPRDPARSPRGPAPRQSRCEPEHCSHPRTRTRTRTRVVLRFGTHGLCRAGAARAASRKASRRVPRCPARSPPLPPARRQAPGSCSPARPAPLARSPAKKSCTILHYLALSGQSEGLTRPARGARAGARARIPRALQNDRLGRSPCPPPLPRAQERGPRPLPAQVSPLRPLLAPPTCPGAAAPPVRASPAAPARSQCNASPAASGSPPSGA
jgi:hypothetical protein